MGIDKESHFASSKLEPGVTKVSQGLFSVMNIKMIREFRALLTAAWALRGNCQETIFQSLHFSSGETASFRCPEVTRPISLPVACFMKYTEFMTARTIFSGWVSFFLKPSL